MNQYKYIGYYNDNADIKDIIACNGWANPEELASYYGNGFGNFHKVSEPDYDYTPADVDNKDIFITRDGRYIIKYSEGHYVALDEDDTYGVNAGFFIDVWERDDDEVDLSDETLEEMSDRRNRENRAISAAIREEFKARFNEPLDGLDLYNHADRTVAVTYPEEGCISQMYLGKDGKIKVTVSGMYDDTEADFENSHFQVDDWPLLLLNVRKGIRDDWTIDE